MKASSEQVRALQSLWSRYADAADLETSRETRLQWAAQQLGREVASFSELTGREAGLLIDELKGALGQPVRRRRMEREAAEHFALDGRKGRRVAVEQMATAEHHAEITALRERLGWPEEEFTHWLRFSRSSPVAGGGGKLLTVSACNRVRWALKAMLKRVEKRAS